MSTPNSSRSTRMLAILPLTYHPITIAMPCCYHTPSQSPKFVCGHITISLRADRYTRLACGTLPQFGGKGRSYEIEYGTPRKFIAVGIICLLKPKRYLFPFT